MIFDDPELIHLIVLISPMVMLLIALLWQAICDVRCRPSWLDRIIDRHLMRRWQ
jgi:hypothetical protein